MLAKSGCVVTAFDLSPGSLAIARALAASERLSIEFDEMSAENLRYADQSFDVIVARDILHHVDIARTLVEVKRVARPGAVLNFDELYSHSWTYRIRNSRLVEQVLYPRLRRFVYGTNYPYITADERKLTENDLALISGILGPTPREDHFDLFVTRLVPNHFVTLAKLDRSLLRLLGPFARLVSGRIVLTGSISN